MSDRDQPIRHELDDAGFVSPRCDVEAASRHRLRVAQDDWPSVAEFLPNALREQVKAALEREAA